MLMRIILIITSIGMANAKLECPTIPENENSIQTISMMISATLDIPEYDTRRIKYYVMTPRSYPDFENSEGNPVDWTSIGCEGRPVLFSCHGWRETYDVGWSIDLVRTFVVQCGGCAVASDYSGASESLNLLAIAGNTGGIAEAIANYVTENICTDYRNCTRDLQLHGHSWGAHTCGIAGYLLGRRGMKPSRFLASDAAGPIFNLFPDNDLSKHLSPESAAHVINVKTSAIAGAGKSIWAHQTQYVGMYGSNQDQCSSKLDFWKHETCDHATSTFVIKCTMNRDFPRIKLNKCSFREGPIPVLEQCTHDQDYLGWRSEAKPGIFMIPSLPVCLNVTLDNEM